MMPPINGMQAMAAATLEGKPVDVDFAVVPGSGPGGGGGWVGTSSGITYIHKLESVLSSIFLARSSFSLPIATVRQYHAFLADQINDQDFLFYARLHPHRGDRRPCDYRYHDGHGLSGLHYHFRARQSDKRHEQPSPDRALDADLP